LINYEVLYSYIPLKHYAKVTKVSISKDRLYITCPYMVSVCVCGRHIDPHKQSLIGLSGQFN
jgi:hypothetical protein